MTRHLGLSLVGSGIIRRCRGRKALTVAGDAETDRYRKVFSGSEEAAVID